MKKIFLILIAILLIGGLTGYLLLNEKLPEGTDPESADVIARQMMASINDSAWQATAAIEWTFMNNHHHLWDKNRHLARVQWKDFDVLVDINTISGKATKNGKILTGKKSDKAIRKAWKFWANDSFWLNPVSKAFDDGTQRYLVKLKGGRNGLMVSYSSGGITPGDSYVWLLDENQRPESWKMWVSILPIGGLEVPWNNWITTETGVQICNLHDAAIDLKLTDIRTAFRLEDLTGGEDPFDTLF